MHETENEIVEAALRLPEVERLAIVDRLLATLPDELPRLPWDDSEFVMEIQRRSGDWDGAIAWDALQDERRRSS